MEEAEDVVRKITFEGKKYLKSKKTGVIYNLNEDVIGKWNEAKNRIDFDEYDSQDSDEERQQKLLDDEEIRKDAEVYEETIRTHFDERFPITDPNKRPLVSLPLPEKFVLTPKEEKLYEANKELFKRRFKDYLTKSRAGTVIFYQESDEIQRAIWKMIDAKKWNNGSGRPLMSRIDEIEYKLDDMKKELDATDNPETKKMIMRMMRQIVKEAPEAKRLDDIYDELVRQYWERRNMKDAENETKRYLKEVEDKRLRDIENEKRRIASEAQRKRNEEVQTQRAKEMAESKMMAAEEAPQQKLRAKERKFLDEIDTAYKRIAFYDDRVTEGKVIKRVTKPVTEIKKEKYLELQELLKRLNEKPTELDSSTLKKNIEDALIGLKIPFLIDVFRYYNQTRNMLKNPSSSTDIASLEKKKNEYRKLIEDNGTKEEQAEAVALLKQQVADEKAGKSGPQALYNRLKAKQEEEKTGVGLKGMTNEVEKRKEVMKYSDPKKALENAIKYLKKDIVFSLSTKPKKKYMVMNPDTMKWTHFGEIGYEDFLKHQDPIRQNNYLKRTANMKGNWKNDKYSANNLAREILWR